MAVAMAVVYGDAIRAGGSVAGLAFGETGAAVTPAAPTPGLCPWFLGEAAQHPPLLLRSFDGLVRDMAEAQEQSGVARPVPLMVIQSTMDRVVRAENARMLRDVWIAQGGGDPEAVRRLGTGPVEHDRWVDGRGDALVETVFFEGRGTDPTHYWPGDHHHPPFAHSAGPSASRLLLEFFRQNGL
jgi:poly(3-hydroxybutyrate) depolymerase